MNIAQGAAWMLLVKLAERSLGMVSVLVLARLLVPADFGLVAMAMSVIALVELAGAFSFELALIQKEHPTRADYDTTWTLQVLFGTATSLIMAALAYPAAVFYVEPRLTLVVLVLAGSTFLQSFENVGIVNFRRAMAFSREFSFLTTKRVTGFVVVVSLAFWFQSYWALIAGSVATRLTGVVLSYCMQPYRPRFALSARRELFSFSIWLFLNSLASFAATRLSHFVVGRLHGPAALGLYVVGAEIAFLPATELVAPINRAAFPGYARLVSDVPALRQSYLDVIGMIELVALPSSFGIAMIAGPLVQTLLGDKWAEAAVFVQVLAFTGTTHALMSNNHVVWLALGKTRTSLLVIAPYFLALLPLMAVLSSKFGVLGIAYAELSASGFGLLASYFLLFRVLQVSVSRWLAGLWRPVLAATVMAVGVATLLERMAGGPHPASAHFQFAVAIPAGALIYTGALALLWLISGSPRGAEAWLLDSVRQSASAWRRKPKPPSDLPPVDSTAPSASRESR